MISALLTDLYQLTMANGLFLEGRAEDQAVFHLFFRKAPFGGAYALAAGIEPALDMLARFRFTEEEIAYLRGLRGADEAPLFAAPFLDHLAGLRLTLDVEAVEEGTPVFPHEPLLRVRGNLLEAQLVETALLNLVNFHTLVATKAARVCQAAGHDTVLEFGLRRAQGTDGALAASRAAYLGGCAATSNVLAGMRYGIPVRGTHAHSWVMSFDSELEAFEAYARAMPNNCVFLVDTYDTLEGVRHAIAVGHELRRQGKRLLGVRLDSGDLATLSRQARALLDDAGFEDAAVVASNDLDERLIESLKQQGARIAVWGVGTKLVTAYDQPALGGVYKLAMIGRRGGPLAPRVKVSENAVKTSIPGVQQVRRFFLGDTPVADMIFDESDASPPGSALVDLQDGARERRLGDGLRFEDLLTPAIAHGERVRPERSLEESRRKARRELDAFDPSTRRFLNPTPFAVGLAPRLHAERARLVGEARAIRETAQGGERP
jgi:nicotinate phosphoribosyltransferase